MSCRGQRTRAYYARIRIVASASLPRSSSSLFLFLLSCCLLSPRPSVVVYFAVAPPWKSIVFTFTCGSGKLHKLKFENVNSPHSPHLIHLCMSSPRPLPSRLNDGSCYVLALSAVRNRSPESRRENGAVCFMGVLCTERKFGSIYKYWKVCLLVK